MDNTLLTAIIAASSALLGSLIPTAFTYLNSKRQNEFELRKTLIEKQKGVYLESMQSLQDMINKQGDEEFLELQKSVIKIAVYGDDKTSTASNKYYRELTQASQTSRGPLTKEDHQQFQKTILNGMRENLGLTPFDHFEIVGFRPEEAGKQ